ncbi:MAG: ketoacyl-ACP synthase III [Thermoguttaceae bacterium]|nr:ketoacyl-ACP synthase III [Thermoguttaceae bacterium]
MAFLHFNHIRIAGFGAGVPKNVVENDEGAVSSDVYSASDFVKTTGVRRRRVDFELTTSDLCLPAAERLIADLGWDKKEIDALIFVSQTADYFLPATACILQDKLGLGRECYAADVSLGCSGWVYGLSYVASLIESGTIRKAILLAGDAKRHYQVRHFDPLFGCAGTVTAVEFAQETERLCFHFGTDGSGFDAIIIPDGGARNQVSVDSFREEEFEGKMVSRLQTRMKGMDVFAFGISTVPKSIKKLTTQYNLTLEDYDYFIFHQANMKMNEVIRNKLKLPEEKVPYSMPDFGNTSSASIPLTIVTELREVISGQKTNIITCGFGVGLSWGTAAMTLDADCVISELTEVQ